MKKLSVVAVVLSLLSLVLTVGPRVVSAATSCSVPNSFVNGTTADANQVNANFNAVATCVVSGLFTGAVVAGASNVGTPVSGDLWAARSTSSGQLNLGGTAASMSLDFGTTTGSDTTLKPGGRFWITTPTLAASDSLTEAYLPPVYANSGGSLTRTTHAVEGACVFSASTTCTINFSGPAAFTSFSSYACSASWVGSDNGEIRVVNFTLAQIQLIAASATSQTAGFLCLGS